MEEGIVDKIKSASHAAKMLIPGKRAAHEKQLRDKQVAHDMKHMDDDAFFRKYPELNHDEHEYSPNNFVDPKKHWPTPDGKRPKSDHEAMAMRNATKKQHAPDIWDKLATSKRRLPRAVEMFEFDKTQFAKDAIARIDRMVSEKAQALRDEVAARLFNPQRVEEDVEEIDLDTPIVVEGTIDGELYQIQFANIELYEEWSDTEEAEGFNVTSIREADSIKEEVDESFLDESGEVSELSKKTLGSYIKKASDNMHARAALGGHQTHPLASKSQKKAGFKDTKKSYQRLDNIKKATDKLTKEEEEVNELSKRTLKSYLRQAPPDLDIARKGEKEHAALGNDRASKLFKAFADKRQKGMETATKKLRQKETPTKKLGEEEEVSELSKATLGKYIDKARESIRNRLNS